MKTSKPTTTNVIAKYLGSHFGVENVNHSHLQKVLQRGVSSGDFKLATCGSSSRFHLSSSTIQQEKPKNRKVTPQKKTPPHSSSPSPSPSPSPPSPSPSPRPSSSPLSLEIKVEDFKRKQQNGATKLFYPFSLAGHSWSLLVFPNGNKSSSHLSIYIIPEGPAMRREVEKLRISFKGKEREVTKRTSVMFEVEGSGVKPRDWGFHRFMELDKLEEGKWLREGEFSVVVEIEMA